MARDITKVEFSPWKTHVVPDKSACYSSGAGFSDEKRPAVIAAARVVWERGGGEEKKRRRRQ